MTNKTCDELLAKVERTHDLSPVELVELLTNTECGQALYQTADRVREKYLGSQVELRGLVEFSNICRQDCFYCGLRRSNTVVERYRLEPDMIVEFAEKAIGYGYKTIVLQSGEDPYYSEEILCDVIRRIKKLGAAITLSIGERSREEYAAFRQAGADRYLLRIETTDKDLYEKLDPGMSWENRIRCLKDLKELGYEVGTGSLIGLPGQTVESLANDLLFFKALDADMIGVGPFIANPDTPLAGSPNGTFDLACRMMALIRLLIPDANIPATTAMESLHPEGRSIALQRGANVVMPNVTESDYRRMYALYPGKICINDTPAHCRACITGKINAIGRQVSQDHGFRRKRMNPATGT